MKAPPLTMEPPASLTEAAVENRLSWSSTEQGPAMTANRLPPNSAPPTLTMESSWWLSRLTRSKAGLGGTASCLATTFGNPSLFSSISWTVLILLLL